MTKAEFADKYKHAFYGILLDTLTNGAKGGDLAMKVKLMMATADGLLASAYSDLCPDAPLPVKPTSATTTTPPATSPTAPRPAGNAPAGNTQARR